ncbi:hypothetical protein PANT_9d00263 [Moesziomyces antarcticus T-34]|uniref:Uncharacterized protein n=1 Tax=Pseudozyma antarctica (strain T-34) TaxID=1151754 RepID=M9LP31_PSEA3|nr:hypothetical protein PANT_9d00263 [Moesziomyces antarcticus T-34]
MTSATDSLVDARPPSIRDAKHDDPLKPPQNALMAAVQLKPSHPRSRSGSDSSHPSSDFDHERPSQDDDDIDNTPATSYGGFLSTRSDISAGPKSDSSHLSHIGFLNSAHSVAASDDELNRMDEVRQEVEALFEKFLPDFQVHQDDDQSSQHGQDAEPTLLSRNLPAILSEFERQRDHPLIDPKVYSQLQVFADENPEVPISSNMLVNLIHALESSAQSVASEEMDPRTPSLMERHTSHSTGNDSTPIAASDKAEDIYLQDYLIPDADTSRESSREMSAEATVILNLKEDLRMERERNDALQQTLCDKERRVNTLEHKLTTAQEQYEEMMLEEQAKLDELHKQIQTLRRDEKELRTRHHELQEQNNAFEAQLTALNAQIEASEKANVKVRRDLEEESSQLIKAKADLDRRAKEAKELSEYLVECEQAKDIAENAQHQLRQELDKARAETAKLQPYKEEAEESRTTVDKLEMELDEMRRLTSLHSKESSALQHSNPGTMTRRLGNELARSMDLDGHSSSDDTQVEDKDADSSNVDDFIETVIQRRRRRVGKARKSVEMVTQATQTELKDEPSVATSASGGAADATVSLPDVATGPTKKLSTRTSLYHIVAAVRARSTLVAILVLIIGLSIGLMLNTSRDLYHINDYALDADEYRKLNHPPDLHQHYYYDSRYPNARVGPNLLDDYVAPVVDFALSLLGLGNPARSMPGGVVY